MDDLRSDPDFAGITGTGYSIVIIDSGIDRDHPFFGPDADHNGISDRIVYSYDYSGTDDANATDTLGHGSNVASIAASSDSTWTGIAPGANIIALKVFPDNSNNASGQDIQQALAWVINHVQTGNSYNIVSVNLSLGSGNYSVSTTWGPEFATLSGLNVICVAASGNQYAYYGQGVANIAADPYVLAVGAVYCADIGSFSLGYGDQAYSTAPDRIAAFSQRDPALLDILAPGAPITGE